MARKNRKAEIAVKGNLLIPKPEALVESMRAFGYDLETAIADLIDNSITAQAKNIWIDFMWNGEESSISIKDDGVGMDRSELQNSMRLGSSSPNDLRSSGDLGRFGLGLKTASFSQCRRLAVRSKKQDKTSTFVWDLDHIVSTNKWMVLETCSKQEENAFKRIENINHGTIVLWTKLDRITDKTDVEDENDKKYFYNRIARVHKYIGMVFHRFIDNGINIFVNKTLARGWDPFLKLHPSTQKLAEESIASGVAVTSYVLPHHTKLNKTKFGEAGGSRGWYEHQGFYIYRNGRMLVAGHWLNFFIKEDRYQLARICIDISNSNDSEWGIDVKKSKASPPDYLKKQLRHIAEKTRNKSFEIYQHRGTRLNLPAGQGIIFGWDKIVKHGKIKFVINRKHPAVENVLKLDASRGDLARMLRIIEESLPISSIVGANSENPFNIQLPFEDADDKEVLAIANEAYNSLRKGGLSHRESMDRVCQMDSFTKNPAVMKLICKNFEQYSKEIIG